MQFSNILLHALTSTQLQHSFVCNSRSVNDAKPHPCTLRHTHTHTRKHTYARSHIDAYTYTRAAQTTMMFAFSCVITYRSMLQSDKRHTRTHHHRNCTTAFPNRFYFFYFFCSSVKACVRDICLCTIHVLHMVEFSYIARYNVSLYGSHTCERIAD